MSAALDLKIRPPAGLDPRPVAKRIGLVILSTDHTAERDFRRICPEEGLGIYVNRILYENPTTPENLRSMQPRLTEGAALIFPDETLDAICYACTAASVVMGDGEVAAAIQAAKPGVPVVTPTLAARLAFQALGVSRITLVTPYSPEVSAAMGRYFVDHGLDLRQLTCFGMEDDREMARISTENIVTAALEALTEESQGLFLSCTALRSAEVAAEIEARCGRPVVTSNQASAWLSLRYAGIEDALEGHGRLLTLPLPKAAA